MEPIKRMPNGSKAKATFSPAEMARRPASPRADMAAADLPVLTGTGADDMTGFPFGSEHNIVAA